ncbi:MAG: hypothetical protein M3Z10_00945 [Gemmatimonadota bacterium]|nr:hypothetical protein [Gemmatimonadota bacterium]
MWPFVVLAIFLVMFLSIWISARRFEAVARKAGRWDDRGPLIETEGPSYHYRNSSMDERREVIGNWTPPIVKDRRGDASRRSAQNDDRPTGENAS